MNLTIYKVDKSKQGGDKQRIYPSNFWTKYFDIFTSRHKELLHQTLELYLVKFESVSH